LFSYDPADVAFALRLHAAFPWLVLHLLPSEICEGLRQQRLDAEAAVRVVKWNDGEGTSGGYTLERRLGPWANDREPFHFLLKGGGFLGAGLPPHEALPLKGIVDRMIYARQELDDFMYRFNIGHRDEATLNAENLCDLSRLLGSAVERFTVAADKPVLVAKEDGPCA
jgi:hypothetical protein